MSKDIRGEIEIPLLKKVVLKVKGPETYSGEDLREMRPSKFQSVVYFASQEMLTGDNAFRPVPEEIGSWRYDGEHFRIDWPDFEAEAKRIGFEWGRQ